MTMFEYTKKAYLAMKEKPKKERWQYFLDYYKWPALAVLLVIVLVIQTTVAIVTRKDVVFSGVLVDGYSMYSTDEFEETVGTYLGIDTKKEKVQFQTGLSLESGMENNKVESFQQILAGLTIKATDFITAPEDPFELCAYHTSGMFADLRDYMDADTLAKLEGKLFYIDRTVFKQLQEATAQGIILSIEYPDPLVPEDMDDPVPVGVDISGHKEFRDEYYMLEKALYLGMAVNTTRPEMVLKFLDFLLA